MQELPELDADVCVTAEGRERHVSRRCMLCARMDGQNSKAKGGGGDRDFSQSPLLFVTTGQWNDDRYDVSVSSAISKTASCRVGLVSELGDCCSDPVTCLVTNAVFVACHT